MSIETSFNSVRLAGDDAIVFRWQFAPETFHLRRCAELMLPFVPRYPGLPWFEIIEMGPRNGQGHRMSKSQSIDPLVRVGLVKIKTFDMPESGPSRPWDRYYRV